jgi:hypothetical protein
MRWAMPFYFCVLIAAQANAQERTQLPRNDVSISIGWSGASFPASDEYNQWGSRFYAGGGVAHYWTDHLKTEAELGWFSPVRNESYEPVVFPDGSSSYARSDYVFRDLRASFAQSFQFGRNAWVHPYIGAGADVSVLRIEELRPAQSVQLFTSRTNQTRNLPAFAEEETETRIRPFVKTGLKLYMSDRGFVTTELKFAIHSGIEDVLWKTSLGFDF